MPSFNRATLLGHVGRSELRTLEDGTELLKFSLATNYGKKLSPERSHGQGEEWEQETTWHQCTVWNPSNHVVENVIKGALVLFEGRITERKWTAKNGEERRSTEIVGKAYPCTMKRKESSDEGFFDERQPERNRTGDSPYNGSFAIKHGSSGNSRVDGPKREREPGEDEDDMLF